MHLENRPARIRVLGLFQACYDIHLPVLLRNP
jgi:hypothetical protein